MIDAAKRVAGTRFYLALTDATALGMRVNVRDVYSGTNADTWHRYRGPLALSPFNWPDLNDDATWGILVGACRRRLGETFGIHHYAAFHAWFWNTKEGKLKSGATTRFGALADVFEHIDTLEVLP